jgi:ubiquinone/menaquinone biosynthesis C-methylase UbiE
MPKMMAQQLRKPSGKMGESVGLKMNQGNAALYDFLIKEMKIEDKQSLLEIGFGNGLFFSKIFSLAQSITISGIDFSKTMLKEATKNNQLYLNKGVLDLHFGDCEILPFKDHSFDKVFCINVVYFWKNPSKNLSEIYRVLKPGGKFYSGIRSSESMRKMPFTQYGFKIYETEEWEEMLVNNQFSLGTTSQLLEPEIEFSGVKFIPKSHCFIAQK